MKTKCAMLLLLAAVILLAAVMAGCGAEPEGPSQTQPDPAAELTEAKEALIRDWKAYLAFSDAISRRTLWALDYADAFAREGTWDSLLKAGGACSAVKQELQQLKLPESTLTQAQYALLMDAGIEADVLLLEYENLQLRFDTSLQRILIMEDIAGFDILFTAVADRFRDWMATERRLVELDSAYLCVTTHYLLLQLGDDSLWQTLRADYPAVGAACGAWSSDPDELMRTCGDILDETEQANLEEAEYVGILEYTKSLVAHGASGEDLDRLAGQLRLIPGTGGCFPMPQWMPEDMTRHYLIEDAGTREYRTVEVFEEMAQAPGACLISCGRISREAVEGYADMLEGFGLECYGMWDKENEAWHVYAVSGESRLLVEWTEDETILYLSDPVGCLIPQLCMQAMAAGNG